MSELKPILMTEENWKNSQFSPAGRYGGINWGDTSYVVVDETGTTLFELSELQEKDGREWLIPPGKPADLVVEEFVPFYKKLGREKFIEILQQNRTTPHTELKKNFKETIKAIKEK
jgi:hypothetical protein